MEVPILRYWCDNLRQARAETIQNGERSSARNGEGIQWNWRLVAFPDGLHKGRDFVLVPFAWQIDCATGAGGIMLAPPEIIEDESLPAPENFYSLFAERLVAACQIGDLAHRTVPKSQRETTLSWSGICALSAATEIASTLVGSEPVKNCIRSTK